MKKFMNRQVSLTFTHLLVLMLVFGGVGGAVDAFKPLLTAATSDSVKVQGKLLAVAHTPECKTPLALQAAVKDYQEQERRSPLWRALAPRPAHAKVIGCQVLGVRYLDNLIVTAGKGFLVDAWQNILEIEIMKYHGGGTGTTAAVVGNTALETESTTALNPDSTRATGTLEEGASANIFKSVGTLTFDATAAITEWGLLSQAATGGGTLWSRVVFAAINVASGDSIQFTYLLTVS